MTIDEQLTADLWILDAMLTRRDPRNGRGDVNKLVAMGEFAFGRLHYLSDGGYSRVFFQDGTLMLSAESREQVRDLWEKHDVWNVRNRVENLCWGYLSAEGVLPNICGG